MWDEVYEFDMERGLLRLKLKLRWVGVVLVEELVELVCVEVEVEERRRGASISISMFIVDYFEIVL